MTDSSFFWASQAYQGISLLFTGGISANKGLKKGVCRQKLLP